MTSETADAYYFWKNIGLSVAQNRITRVNVDGGFASPTNNVDGEGETDLDVEYSGALAPGRQRAGLRRAERDKLELHQRLRSRRVGEHR